MLRFWDWKEQQTQGYCVYECKFVFFYYYVVVHVHF